MRKFLTRSRSELRGSDCDGEGITLDILRKDKMLRDLIKKELKGVVWFLRLVPNQMKVLRKL